VPSSVSILPRLVRTFGLHELAGKGTSSPRTAAPEIRAPASGPARSHAAASRPRSVANHMLRLADHLADAHALDQAPVRQCEAGSRSAP
jgi:hypothetical protein